MMFYDTLHPKTHELHLVSSHFIPYAYIVKENHLRNLIFGFEDGFVSTVGVMAGIAAASPTRGILIISGAVLVTVEAFSMAVGGYLTEKSVDQMEGSVAIKELVISAFIMFFSYLAAGMSSMVPYFFVDSMASAVVLSVISTFIGLFFLGVVKGRIVKRNPWKDGIEMMMVAGFAIIVGFIVGHFGDKLLNAV